MRTKGWATFLLVAVFCALWAPAARAQERDGTGVGNGLGSMPALVRVPVAGTMRTGLVIAGHAGYGLTEGVLGEDDSHHRLGGVLATSVRPLDWLGFALRLDGRYDAHSGTQGPDDGIIGEARLGARASTDLSSAFALGFEALVFVPGGAAPSFDFGATTVDANALLAWSPSPAVSVAANIGVRIDGTGRAVPERDLLSRADRLALGASDSNALLFGLGVSWHLPAVEIVAELTSDLLFGAQAPPLGQSPLRVSAGARVPLTDGLALSLLAEAALSSRPPLVAGDALVPVEPRISLLAGLVWQPIGAAQPAEDDALTDDAHHPDTPPIPPRPAATLGRVTGVVHGSDGAPLVGATVSVEGTEPAVQGTTDDAGSYTLEGVPVGREVRLRIAAPGRAESFITVIANAETPTDAGDVVLEATQPAGVIRGVVRSLRGQGGGLPGARIAVEPGGQSVRANAAGEFELEVPPGAYEVVIEADAHETQRRRVTVEQLGVTVLNVDLRRSR